MRPERPSDPERLLIDTRVGRLSYTDVGEGPALVAIAGLPGSVRDWRWLGPELEGALRFVRVDLPGFGESTWPGDHPQTLRQRGEAVIAFIEAMGFGEEVTLMGHSMGGGVCAAAAASRPDLIARLALIASLTPLPHYPVKPYRVFAALMGISALRPVLVPLTRAILGALGFRPDLPEGDVLRSVLDAAGTDFDEHGAHLRALTMPTLIAWAEDDHLIPAANYQALAMSAPQGPRVTFERGGHNIQKTRAVELAASLLGFIER